MNAIYRTLTPVSLFTAFLACAAFSQETSRSDRDLFEIHARPVLTTQCIRCHGKHDPEGGLVLTTREALMKGGESGPAMRPGQPDESLIMEAVRHESLEMPPGEKIDDALIAGLATWIEAGAPWPADVVLKEQTLITAEDKQWWCYQPIMDHQLPIADDWCRNGIDRFVRERQRELSLTPSPMADPVTMVRRVHFTLTGLPPSPDDLQRATEPGFDYEAMVDQLLASKAYGENQARFWLDLVRYADSDGYRADHARPEAYRYRDYVIRSFYEDKPYDQFVREQLAGDEIDPGNEQSLVATMYLRHWIYEHNQRDVETQWHEILSDITETTSDVFLAQGLKCARCHDHKFDPLLQKDYFRMKAFFAAFQPSEQQMVASIEERERYQAELARWETATREIRQELRSIEYPVALEHATREGFEKFVPEIKDMIRKHPSERTPYEHQIASLAERQFDLPYDKLDQWLDDDQKKRRAELKAQLKQLDKLKPAALPMLKFVGGEVGSTAPVTLIPDGDGEKVEPGYLTLLDETDAEIRPVAEILQSTGRRSTLAHWITDRSNPLTARVIVNRIWQQHFGSGIVETTSDFGHLGTPPSHPKLLDWLATRFVKDDNWSLKKLHRRILLSATFRQSSMRPMSPTIAKLDPENRMLWRMNPRRLSGEEIMDAIHRVSGELGAKKRAIYKKVLRNSPDPVLAAFDSPDRIRSTGQRHRTTTSTQALLMSNSAWGHERAERIEARFSKLSSDELIISLHRQLFGRTPEPDEIQLATTFLRQYEAMTPGETPPPVDYLQSIAGSRGNAVSLRPGGPLAMSLRHSDQLPDGDFTVEAIILLRSLYEDASVRTIVAHWNGSKNQPGWSLGVTSKKSAYQPRNLILQLVGKRGSEDKLHYEVIPSNLRPELNKPYYVSVTVKLNETKSTGITFRMKDLSDKDAEMKTAHVAHEAIGGIRGKGDLWLGQRAGNHQWDGLIDQIRIEAIARDLSLSADAESPHGTPKYVVRWDFEDPKKLGWDSSGSGNHAFAKLNLPQTTSPKTRARQALVHAMLNSNEMIYVD